MHKTTHQTIVFTGGGTAGHVTPNLALIEKFKQLNWHIEYIGSNAGIEKSIISQQAINFHGICSGKLRRYFSWQNFIDPCKIAFGVLQAIKHLKRIKPNVVFSKGGFVAVPVIIAAWICKIPIVAHESDFSPGLANKLSFPFVKKLCLSFTDSKRFFSNTTKVIVTGSPIRSCLFQGNAAEGLRLSGLNQKKPVILIIGGGSGAQVINKTIRSVLDKLLNDFQIIHICGPGKMEKAMTDYPGYIQHEYVNDALAHYFALATLVISRAGANTLNEILALEKPHILIPLSKKASRGDQIENAAFTEKLGLSKVLSEEKLTPTLLTEQLTLLYTQRKQYQQKMHQYDAGSGTDAVFNVIIGETK